MKHDKAVPLSAIAPTRYFAIKAAAALLIICFSSCKEAILHDLDELQANKVAVVLGQANIAAKKVREGASWSIVVSAADVNEALNAIDESRLVKPSAAPTKRSSSIILSREERVHLVERDVAASLEQTLERLPDVREARVHLHFPAETTPVLKAAPKDGSGSVLLVAEAPELLNQEHVKELIASAAGIAKNSVAVVVVGAGRQAAHRTERSDLAKAAPPAGSARFSPLAGSLERPSVFLSKLRRGLSLSRRRQLALCLAGAALALIIARLAVKANESLKAPKNRKILSPVKPQFPLRQTGDEQSGV